MKVVYKYELSPASAYNKIDMPKDADVLCVKLQHDKLQLWAFIDTANDDEERTFLMVGTGHEMPANVQVDHISTVMVEAGNYVFHVFEVL